MGHDPAMPIRHIFLHVALREIDHQFHFTPRDRPHSTKWIHAGGKRYLALIDIPQPGKHTLIKQHHRHLRIWILPRISGQARHSSLHGEALRQNIRPQLRHLVASL
jgi:hypothetical protein